jgi:hypothetical protein
MKNKQLPELRTVVDLLGRSKAFAPIEEVKRLTEQRIREYNARLHADLGMLVLLAGSILPQSSRFNTEDFRWKCSAGCGTSPLA